MFQHVWSCGEFNYKLNGYSLADFFADTGTVIMFIAVFLTIAE